MKSVKKEVDKFFEAISTKAKLIIGAVVGFAGFMMFFFISKKVNAKKILELELDRLEHEINIKNTSKDISHNKDEILALEKKADLIKREIEDMGSGKSPKHISQEELDSFFDSRGF